MLTVCKKVWLNLLLRYCGQRAVMLVYVRINGRQVVFRPPGDALMGRAVAAVVSFVEAPAIEGSRDWPVDTLVEVLREYKSALPDLGVAPTALLLAVLDCDLSCAHAGSLEHAPELTPTPSFEQWLSVR